jgi:hypothetical protein
MRMLATVMGIVGCVGVANGMTWDAATDWKLDQNPNGAWSSGLQLTLTDPLILYDSAGSLTARLQWRRSTTIGDACCPGLGQVTEGGYDSVFPEDKIIAHPGPGTDGGAPGNDVKGEYSTLRWTAPADGLYDVTAMFEGLNSTATLAKVTTADVHVQINGVSAFSGIINGYIGGIPADPAPEGDLPTQSWRQIVDLNAGDTVDFAVGDGEDLSYNSDVTGIIASVVLVPEPTTLLVGVMGVVLAAFGVRFR